MYSISILTSVDERTRGLGALQVSPLQPLPVWALTNGVSVGQLSFIVTNAWSSQLPDKKWFTLVTGLEVVTVLGWPCCFGEETRVLHVPYRAWHQVMTENCLLGFTLKVPISSPQCHSGD